MNQNIYAIFAAHFPSDTSRLFLETETGRRYSYRDLDEISARLARWLLDQGMRAGDRVAVQVEKSAEAYFLYLATLRAGLVYLPLNTAYQAKEMEYFLGDAAPRLVVCRPDSAGRLEELVKGKAQIETLDEQCGGSLIMKAESVGAQEFATVQRSASNLAVILYTSGTTGRSKGAMITHGNLAANAEALAQAWGFTADDVLLHALPLFHIHGLFLSSHCALMSGAAMLFVNKFDPKKILSLLPRATVFMGVPTYYTRLLAEPTFDGQACKNIRLFVSGSAPLLTETFNEFRERTGQTILERYGMTETGVNTSNPLHGERRAGTVGMALPGNEIRVVNDGNQPVTVGEIGHIQARGANVFPGYWQMPEKTAEEFTTDGFFKTGDMGQFDADGYLSIVGRSKDMVISGGYNVYPKEIESILDALPGVVESAIIGVPHRDFGEAVTAMIVRDGSGNTPDEAVIIAQLKSELANYKVPKRVFFVDELPRNTMGKVQKNVLRERYKDLFKP